jgi:predicted esterase
MKPNKAMEIISNPLYDDVSKISVGRIIKKTLSNSRYYLHTIPAQPKNDLILFYHGSRDTAWAQALEYTNLVSTAETNNCIIVFGQASGTINKPTFHPYYLDASFGELYWEIRDYEPQFKEDLAYTQTIITEMQTQYDINHIYFIGHSNGGVFAILLALYMPNTFRAVVSHMGGIGYDPAFYLNFDLLKETDQKVPILFYTGENDIHRKPCESAQNIFRGEDFSKVDIHIELDIGHEYLANCEDYILNWLKSI